MIEDDIFAGLDQPLDNVPVIRARRRNRLHVSGNKFIAEPARLTSADDALTFIRAGNAKFTVRSKATGTRFTFRVKTSDDERMRFVAVLNGPDNETSYQYIGHIQIGREIFWHGKKSKIGADAPCVVAFGWVWRQLNAGKSPEQLEVWHEACCGRCGRTLTVPESIASGFGPECAGRIGR